MGGPGSHAAFEALMRRHNRRLFRTARAILRADAAAEDALQDACVAAFRIVFVLREALARELDIAAQGVFAFDGNRRDRIVAAVLRRIMPGPDPGG